MRRRSGRYGSASDVRPQVFGWEYRTMPTWIGSPEIAFIVLTLAKFTVLDPAGLEPEWTRATDNPTYAKGLVDRVARYYADRDSDAALLVNILKSRNGLISKTDSTADIREAWGIKPTKPYVERGLRMKPTAVADQDLVLQMRDRLLGKTKVVDATKQAERCLWKCEKTMFPSADLVPNFSGTYRSKLCEVLVEAVSPKELSIYVDSDGNSRYVINVNVWSKTDAERVESKLKELNFNEVVRVSYDRDTGYDYSIHVNEEVLHDPAHLNKVKKILLSGALPIAHYSASAALAEWRKKKSESKRPPVAVERGGGLQGGGLSEMGFAPRPTVGRLDAIVDMQQPGRVVQANTAPDGTLQRQFLTSQAMPQWATAGDISGGTSGTPATAPPQQMPDIHATGPLGWGELERRIARAREDMATAAQEIRIRPPRRFLMNNEEDFPDLDLTLDE
jgi:hypothetical protein